MPSHRNIMLEEMKIYIEKKSNIRRRTRVRDDFIARIATTIATIYNQAYGIRYIGYMLKYLSSSASFYHHHRKS